MLMQSGENGAEIRYAQAAIMCQYADEQDRSRH